MELEQLSSAVEAILFTADRPITISRLMEVLGPETVSETELTALLGDIKDRYTSSSRGFELREAQGGFHFTTKASNAEWVRRFLQTKPFKLGKSALETLAIIAYRQPVTRAEIDKIRGIDSSHLLRTLVERGLVKMAGKADAPGRPVQYGTTPRFLEVTGLATLGELPPLTELDQLQGNTQDNLKPLEEGLERFVSESASRSEVAITGEDTSGLGEIEQLIESVQKADREIYESELHADIARENEAALEGFLATWPPYRRRRGTAQAAASEEPVTVEVEAVEAVEVSAPAEAEGAEATAEGVVVVDSETSETPPETVN